MGDDEANISSVQLKKGVGKTGVELRYHKDSEFKALSKAQKSELIAWRATPEGKTAVAKEKAARSSKKQNRGGKANISSVVEQEVAKQLAQQSPNEDSESSQDKLFLAAVKAKIKDDPDFAKSVGITKSTKAKVSATTLQPEYLAKIIGRVKNKGPDED